MWDLTDLSIQPVILSHGRARSIRDVAFSDDGKWFAAASSERGDETLILWALTRDDYPPITLLPDKEMYRVQFIPDSDLMRAELFLGGSQLFNLDSNYLHELACVVAGRNFTQAEWAQYFPGEEYRMTCPQWPAGE